MLRTVARAAACIAATAVSNVHAEPAAPTGSLVAAFAAEPTTLDPAKRSALLQEIARKKHEEVLGGLTAHRPLVTLAWRTDKVAFTPWPGAWHDFQQVSIKSAGAPNG